MSTTSRTIAFCIAIVLLIFSALMIYRAQQTNSPSLLEPHQGTYFSAPRDIKQFHLINTQQQSFNGKNLLDQWSIVFFGFTHCHQICPTTLVKLSQAILLFEQKKLPIQVMFITLDPERDTPEELHRYLQHFSPRVIGLSGKISEIRKLQSQLGIYANQNPEAKAGEDTIIHSTSILLINPQAKWTAKLNGDLSPEEWVSAIERIVHLK